MARSLLLVVLFLATAAELVLAGAAFFAPALLLGKFGVKYSADMAFISYVLAWLLLFVTLIAGLAFGQVWKRRPHYSTLCYLLSIWWIGIGLGIYFLYGRPANLLLDTLKGLLILVLTWRCQATRMVTRRY